MAVRRHIDGARPGPLRAHRLANAEHRPRTRRASRRRHNDDDDDDDDIRSHRASRRRGRAATPNPAFTPNPAGRPTGATTATHQFVGVPMHAGGDGLQLQQLRAGGLAHLRQRPHVAPCADAVPGHVHVPRRGRQRGLRLGAHLRVVVARHGVEPARVASPHRPRRGGQETRQHIDPRHGVRRRPARRPPVAVPQAVRVRAVDPRGGVRRANGPRRQHPPRRLPTLPAPPPKHDAAPPHRPGDGAVPRVVRAAHV